ncbi:hypothetical protein [Pseudomonas subflava]|uniref:hypothetical protein n=1 Tax=Pseudomonas subflava TaxID=2952933 RepID=UPI00207ACD57|nr:hypothetical protein [Pseudomonas subflava]
MHFAYPLLRTALLGGLLLGVVACSTVKPTEDRLRTLSETNLGESVTSISNVRSDSMQTYYVASTASGDYNCTVPSGASGGMMTIGSFGMMSPHAICQPKGAKGSQLPPFAQ